MLACMTCHPLAKLRVEGPDATKYLNYLAGVQYDVDHGRIVYSQFLNHNGGIEADVTITRLSTNTYLVVTPAATRYKRSGLDGSATKAALMFCYHRRHRG